MDDMDALQNAVATLERSLCHANLDAAARTVVRARLMRLLDRIEIEQGMRCIVEGNFAAARYHLGVPKRQSMRLRIARIALRVAPRLVRRCCLQLPAILSFRPATS